MKRKKAALLAFILGAGFIAGCGGTSGSTSSGSTVMPGSTVPSGNTVSSEKKVLVIGDTTFNAENWEETIDPHRTYNGWPCIRYGVGETLVHYTDTMELEPWLAESWENDGGCTWTVRLREGVHFSSGREMDAAAVKECFEHLLENHDRAPLDTKIEAMEADGQVLTIRTSEPNPALMNYLGDPYACVIDVAASDFDTGISSERGSTGRSRW